MLVFGVVRPFVLEAFRIPSESMVPTLLVGDRVLANKFIYRLTDPERGDVVVFESVGEGRPSSSSAWWGWRGTDRGAQRHPLVNGEEQEEPYLNENLPFTGSYEPTEVPEASS